MWREELGIEPMTFQTLVGCSTVDCEQSLIFFIFSEGSARARTSSGEAARREKRGWQPEKADGNYNDG